MFQNYNEPERPMHNDKATHYGCFSHTEGKRIGIFGAVCNENPLSATKTVSEKRGLLYCASTQKHNHMHVIDKYSVGDLVETKVWAPPPRQKDNYGMFKKKTSKNNTDFYWLNTKIIAKQYVLERTNSVFNRVFMDRKYNEFTLCRLPLLEKQFHIETCKIICLMAFDDKWNKLLHVGEP
eukprot:UN31328